MARFVRIKVLEPDYSDPVDKQSLKFRGIEVLLNEDDIKMVVNKGEYVEVWTSWSGDLPAYNADKELLGKLRIA